MTAHRGRLNPQPRSWATLLLSGHTAPKAPETTREEGTGDHIETDEMTREILRAIGNDLKDELWITINNKRKVKKYCTAGCYYISTGMQST